MFYHQTPQQWEEIHHNEDVEWCDLVSFKDGYAWLALLTFTLVDFRRHMIQSLSRGMKEWRL